MLNPSVIERKYKIEHKTTATSRSVTHLTYLDWPDKDTVSENRDQIHYLQEVIDRMLEEKKRSDHPILTHCSAGVGRSGTTQALYFLFKEIEAYKKAHVPVRDMRISVFNIVRALREERIASVQVPA